MQQVQPKLVQDSEPDFDFDYGARVEESIVVSQEVQDDIDDVSVSQLKHKCKEAMQ